ncbi:MAG: hypothetical protein ACLKAK_07285 [Alkaliphilus sp.]
MKSVIKDLRAANQRLINEDLVVIIIHRKEFISNPDGGRLQQVSVLPSFMGRIVTTKQRPRISQPEAGMRQVASGLVLIAPHDVFLRWGSDVVDEFTLPDGRAFQIARVILRSFGGETYAVHALLEEVS